MRFASNAIPSTSSSGSFSSMDIALNGINDYYSTFIPLQIWLDKYFITHDIIPIANQTFTALELLDIELRYQPFWTEEYEKNVFIESMGNLLPFYIMACFILPFSYVIKDIVEEKSQRIKGLCVHKLKCTKCLNIIYRRNANNGLTRMY